MKASSNSRSQKSNTSRKAEEARVNARTEKEHLDAVDTLDLSKFTDREKAIISRASAFLVPLSHRYFVRAARRDVDATANAETNIEFDIDELSPDNRQNLEDLCRKTGLSAEDVLHAAVRNLITKFTIPEIARMAAQEVANA